MTPAIKLLQKNRIQFTLHEYEHVPSTDSLAEEVAQVLGVDAQRVFKTLVCDISGGKTPFAVGIVPAVCQLDLKALAAAVEAKKASLADPQSAERITGYVVGGISPLGQRKRLPTVLDQSASQHGTIYVSGGRRGIQIEIAPMELVRLCNARIATIGH